MIGIAVVAVGALCTGSAVAESRTWVNVVNNGLWCETGNWQGGTLPAADGFDTLVLSKFTNVAPGNLAVQIDRAASV